MNTSLARRFSFLLFLVLFVPFCVAPLAAVEEAAAGAAAAQHAEENASGEKHHKKKVNMVARELKHFKWLRGGPSVKARYYMVICAKPFYTVLRGKYYCKPVRSLEEEGKDLGSRLKKHYAEMKKDGNMEILIFSSQAEEEDARVFLKSRKLRVPLTLFPLPKGAAVPGAKEMKWGMNCMIVRAEDGAVLAQGTYQDMLPRWEECLQAADEATAAAEGGAE